MDWREALLGGHVNPGWEPLVDELHAKVLELDPDVVVEQVKEKYGGLRYYFNTLTDHTSIEAIVSDYEARSKHTCEVCGEPGKTDAFGTFWLNTLCDKHGEIKKEHGTPAWEIAADEADAGDATLPS
jgi:hypothetical protein